MKNIILKELLCGNSSNWRLKMRLSIFLLFISLFHIQASTYSQSKKITLDMESVPVESVLEMIESQSEFTFLCNISTVNVDRIVSVKARKKPVHEILDLLFVDTNTIYNVVDRQIILTKGVEINTPEILLPEEINEPIQQEIEIKGTVNDEIGMPLPGANVIIKGTNKGVTTDFDGNYSLSVLDTSVTLVFSFIGMKTQEVAVGTQSTINIVLLASSESIDEVVITALGISREKKALGYSVGEVKAEQLTMVPQENAINALTGKVAGLRITSTSGDINSETIIQIRGRTSLAANDSPLIVIDGVPAGNDAGVISDMNANSIASVSVLKGPSAAALYGSRAGNGVVIVTTKSGASGKKGIGVSYDTSITVATPFKFFELQDRFTTGKGGIFNEGNNQHWYGPEEGASAVQWNSNGESVPLVFYEDTQKKFFDTGFSLNNSLAVAGSYDKGSFRIGISDIRAGGTLPGSELFKNSMDVAVVRKITDKLKVSANVILGNSHSDNFRIQRHNDYPYRDIQFIPNHVDINDLRPIWAEGQEDIQQLTIDAGYDNAWFTALETVYKFEKERVNANVKLDYEINDDFSLFARVGRSSTNLINDHEVGYSARRARSGQYEYEDTNSVETNIDMLVSYTKEVGDFGINVSAGGNSLFQESSYSYTGGAPIVVPGLFTGSNIDRGGLTYITNHFDKRVYSVYGLGSFSYKNFAYLDVTARNDWSSTLPEDNRSYFYPSASLSILLSEMFEMPEAISFLKIRGGWAEVGRDTDPYQLGTQLIGGNYGSSSTYSVGSTLPHPNLKPETTISSEIGFDTKFFSNRLGLNFTYYEISNEDQIVNVSVPAFSGYTSAQVNAGIVENKGIEIELNTVPVLTDAVRWDLNFNYSKEKSQLIELAEGVATTQIYWSSIGARSYTEVGGNIGDIYIRDVKRVADGEYQGWPLLDSNGKTQNAENYELYGNAMADFHLGMQTSVSYKNFTFSASIDSRFGGEYHSLSMVRWTRGGKIEDWNNGVSSSTFSGILDNNSFNGDNDALANEIKNNPTIRDNNVWVGGRTADLGGWPHVDGGNDGSFMPGVRDNGDGTYAENFGADGTKFIRADEVLEPGSGWWGAAGQNWVYDSSYAKLREIALSYSFTDDFSSKLKAENISLGMYARNIMLWTKAQNGLDPEFAFTASGNGAEQSQGYERWGGAGPWTANFGLKLNIQF
jgi:TonB-linked SusC/RagA family outer membrane protein